MTLLFIDSWDHYDTGDILKKWDALGTTPVITAAAGRNGTDGMVMNNDGDRVEKNIGDQVTVIVGVAFKTSTTVGGGASIFNFYDAATIQIGVGINAGGFIEVRRNSITGGGTLLGTSSQSLAADTYQFIEIKITFDNAAGAVDIRLNEVNILSLAGVDTQQSGNAFANIFKLNGKTAVVRSFDDLHIMNASGAVNNDFIGDHRVEALLPDGAGNAAQWDRFPDTGEANWEDVDENPADDDTTYTHQDGAGLPQHDTHTMDNLVTTSGVIAGAQTLLDARKDDAAAVTINPTIRSGGADYQRTNVNLSDAYLYYLEIEETDPDTAAAWLIAAINAVEFGYRRTA